MWVVNLVMLIGFVRKLMLFEFSVFMMCLVFDSLVMKMIGIC